MRKDDDLFVEDFKDYLPNQLKQLLLPKEVEKDHGIPQCSLKYMKEQSNLTGTLRGPFFFQDGDITWYPRKAVITYKRKIMFSSGESSESSESSEIQKIKQSK